MRKTTRPYRGLAFLQVLLYILAGVSVLAGLYTMASMIRLAASMRGLQLPLPVLPEMLSSMLATAISRAGTLLAVVCLLLGVLLFAAGKLVGLNIDLIQRVRQLEQMPASAPPVAAPPSNRNAAPSG